MLEVLQEICIPTHYYYCNFLPSFIYRSYYTKELQISDTGQSCGKQVNGNSANWILNKVLINYNAEVLFTNNFQRQFWFVTYEGSYKY